MIKRISVTALLAGLLSLPAPVLAQTDPGAYLAARSAASFRDYAPAATYFEQALQEDPENPALLESAAISYVALGDIDRAAVFARRIQDAGLDSQIGSAVRATIAGKTGDWAALLSVDEPLAISPLFDELARAWAMVGQGNMTDALSAFDAVANTEGMRSYGLLHKAYALATVGDYEGAVAILADPGDGTTAFSPRAAIAHAQILSQLDRNEDALAVVADVFGETLDPGIVAMRSQLTAGESLPYDIVTNAVEGLGEVAFMIGSLLAGEAQDDYILQYARMAQYLAPDSVDATLLTAALLQDMQRYDLANEAFARVPATDPAYPSAELGRIDSLRLLGRDDAAIEVAQALARSHPDLPYVQSRLADVLRDDGQLAEAKAAYTTAIDLYPETDPNLWIIYYSRAIVSYDMDDWPAAESDFRKALELEPNRPEVLNYLGYSLVERGEKLDEALDMIERAVAGRPDSGAIIDSLGWVYYTLGRYREAVEPLEAAAALEATDPIVNDHLGDAYWAVGRQREARFQWQRALSFEPEPDLADRIRAKLELGLDAVRDAEGKPPIVLATEPNP
ncbi:tetratricopeptide repeat protein [Loktanella sp. SALINAS62]|uniref:tetratricopeptide repeat protein n=1 Tax=Loktanella sp. SALINAS62 TaxID=2706124 RepID=UPI001B8D2BFF|nr:tetratricopeptide repeat protein [Loktanella sp. SALINAS62]MBS1302096.1 tetratricopeptide repeat protein [Loktanella sp. SALINAS62]